MSDRRAPFDSSAVGPAVATGLLYSICYHLWVLTGIEAFGVVPIVVLSVAYLSLGGVAGGWRCRACGAVALGPRCPRCESENPAPGPSLERTARYAVVVPAGALAVEFLGVILLRATFQWFGHVSVVSWYSGLWYGTVGLFGPMGLFLLTLTAPVAYLFSVGVSALWAVVASVSRTSR